MSTETADSGMTAAPVCPHCGYVERDAWEWNFGPALEGERVGDCNSCGEEFKTEREVSVYYTTTPTASGNAAKARSDHPKEVL